METNKQELGKGDLIFAYLWIDVGSALGGMVRYWCPGFAAARFGETFPWGTIAVDGIGSFVIGFFATICEPDGRLLVPSLARQFVTLGLYGGLIHPAGQGGGGTGRIRPEPESASGGWFG